MGRFVLPPANSTHTCASLGGITIETSDGQKIKLTATGIEIDNGLNATIKLSGPTVKINGQALEVT